MNKDLQPLNVIGARPYDEVRGLCHSVKNNDDESIRQAARQIAEALPECILIPMPGHLGWPAPYTRELVEYIALEMRQDLKRVAWGEAIRTNPHESLCALKHAGKSVDQVKFSARWISGKLKKELLRLVKVLNIPVILVDNVVDTGKTARICMKPFLSAGIKDIRIAAVGDTGNHLLQNASKD